jgi:hypothetical protein
VSYPELYSDERIVLQAQNVKVKSVSFEVILTTRRLVLIDAKKESIPPQEINLATLKDVEAGENAIRDPTITISIITISGNTRQMVLTFSKTSGGERRRECDDWVRMLRENITTMIRHPVTQDAHHPDQEPSSVSHYAAPAPDRIEVTNTPPQQKKRIEIARPMKKITESAQSMPAPVETTTLPTGSFCNRCGNRVPPESVFCNRCGTPVIHDADTGYLPGEGTGIPQQQPAQAAPRIPVPFPGDTTMDRRARPIEQVIHSIEPLIEDSVPRTSPSPLVPARQSHYASPYDKDEPGIQAPQTVANTDIPAGAQPSEVQWPVLSPSEPAGVALPPDGPAATPSPSPSPGSLPPAPPPRKVSFTMVAILALAVLAVIAGVYLFMQMQQETPVITPTPSPTPVIPATTQPAPVPTETTPVVPATPSLAVTVPSPVVPDTGVWVKVSYSNKYTGSIGTPGRLKDVADSGDHFYQISTSDGPVVASIEKTDGSSAELAVDVYKNGVLMKHSATTAPIGIVEIEAILTVPTTPVPPTATVTTVNTTPSANTTTTEVTPTTEATP